MTERVVNDDLRGQFLGVGSVRGTDPTIPRAYVSRIAVPYWFQLPERPTEDMVRQFVYLVDGFERYSPMTLDLDIGTFREIIEDESPLLPDADHASGLYMMIEGERQYVNFKTQQTAPATLCHTVRDRSGEKMISTDTFRFFSTLMKRVARGQAEILRRRCRRLILCQDDPSLGFVYDELRQGRGRGLTINQIIRETADIYPGDAIPAYHYCYDWRQLPADGNNPLWDAGQRIVHLDFIKYPPDISRELGERINRFLESGGGIALGIIPNTDEQGPIDVLSTLRTNLRRVMDDFEACGVDIGLLSENAMISTQCGLSRASDGLIYEIHNRSELFPRVLEEEARLRSRT
ncbi:MAG: hypothetical protein QXS20_09390 [Candidatus Thorarchaeota archaeon]